MAVCRRDRHSPSTGPPRSPRAVAPPARRRRGGGRPNARRPGRQVRIRSRSRPGPRGRGYPPSQTATRNAWDVRATPQQVRRRRLLAGGMLVAAVVVVLLLVGGAGNSKPKRLVPAGGDKSGEYDPLAYSPDR